MLQFIPLTQSQYCGDAMFYQVLISARILYSTNEALGVSVQVTRHDILTSLPPIHSKDYTVKTMLGFHSEPRAHSYPSLSHKLTVNLHTRPDPDTSDTSDTCRRRRKAFYASLRRRWRWTTPAAGGSSSSSKPGMCGRGLLGLLLFVAHIY